MENGIYVFNEYWTKTFDLSFHRDIINITTPYNDYKTFMPGLNTIEASLSIISNGSFEYRKDTFDLIGKNIENMTILELFRIINQKINQRK